MLIRGLKVGDIPQLQELCVKYANAGFDLPKNNVFADALVEHNGKIVAYGIVKILAEAILIMDQSLSVKERVEALTLLVQEAVKETAKKDILELQAVCQPEFSKVMVKHYGFQKLLGDTLVLDI